MHRELFHARLVAQDGAARHGAGGVDGEHRHAVAQSNQVQTQGLNEGGLAHTRHTADAQAKRLAGVRQQGREQFIGLRAVVGAGRFQQRDGFGDGAALGNPATHNRVKHCLSLHSACPKQSDPDPEIHRPHKSV